MVDIRKDEPLCELINKALDDGKILEIRNLPRNGVPMNVCVVEIGRKVMTRRKEETAQKDMIS